MNNVGRIRDTLNFVKDNLRDPVLINSLDYAIKMLQGLKEVEG